jgi:hypothetical protein
MSLLDLPSDSTLEELASWYAEHFAEIKQIRSFLYVTSRRLTDYVKEGGPVRTPAGLLEIVPDGYAWDSEMIKVVMPSLLTGGKVTFTSDMIEKIERILSLALEEVPDVEYEVSWTVDKYAASNVIKQGGEAATKVLEARKPNGSLGVR